MTCSDASIWAKKFDLATAVPIWHSGVMRHSILFVAGVVALVGCNRQDVSTLGQIASKVQNHVSTALGDQSDVVIKSLPLLPPPNAGSRRTTATGDQPRPLED
jgi:hypothetical protein